MDNAMSEIDPVEIAARFIWHWTGEKTPEVSQLDRNRAQAIFEELERRGIKLMRREATEEMVKACWMDREINPALVARIFEEAWDLAPAYSTPASDKS
jgi:ribulose 1,5-bisphosphate synthetase/thiazole synthase